MAFENLEELVVGLYDRGAIGFAATEADFITLKSGRRSPHYVNLRGVMSFDRHHPTMDVAAQTRVRDLVVDGYVDALGRVPHDFEHVVGIPQAVTHLGGAVALRGGYSDLNIRVMEGEKGYGKHKPVEGTYYPGETVVALDDVVTDGKTKSEVVEPLDLTGLELMDFVVLVDREEGGRANVEATGRTLTPVMGMGLIVDVLHDNQRITPQQLEWANLYASQYGQL